NNQINYALSLMRWAYTKRQAGTLSEKEEKTMKIQSLDLMKKALEIKKKENNVGDVSLVYSNLAMLYTIFTDRDSIMYYNEKALQLAQNNKDPLRTAMAYDNIANVYYSKSNFDTAIA